MTESKVWIKNKMLYSHCAPKLIKRGNVLLCGQNKAQINVHSFYM